MIQGPLNTQIPDGMEYGEIVEVHRTKVIGNIAVKPDMVYYHSLRVSTNAEAAQAFYDLLEQQKQGKLINPGIQVEVYPDTGRIKRVVKSWTQIKEQ